MQMHQTISASALTLTLTLALTLSLKSQSTFQKFRQLSGPEKCWVLTHPFVAKKALRVSQHARAVADSMMHSDVLDGDYNGGQVDAFRHAYWMGSLSRAIAWRKARRLGKAHEKGNYKDFKKGKLEDGEIQDARASEMDLWNNAQGIALGRALKDGSDRELQRAVIDAILEGKMRVIRKDKYGRSLDAKGIVVPKVEWLGKWENARVLVPSDA